VHHLTHAPHRGQRHQAAIRRRRHLTAHAQRGLVRQQTAHTGVHVLTAGTCPQDRGSTWEQQGCCNRREGAAAWREARHGDSATGTRGRRGSEGRPHAQPPLSPSLCSPPAGCDGAAEDGAGAGAPPAPGAAAAAAATATAAAPKLNTRSWRPRGVGPGEPSPRVRRVTGDPRPGDRSGEAGALLPPSLRAPLRFSAVTTEDTTVAKEDDAPGWTAAAAWRDRACNAPRLRRGGGEPRPIHDGKVPREEGGGVGGWGGKNTKSCPSCHSRNQRAIG
jgi:hypothetical protein